MYGIFTYIYHKNQLNVGEYTIHGSYGLLYSYLCIDLESLYRYLLLFPKLTMPKKTCAPLTRSSGLQVPIQSTLTKHADFCCFFGGKLYQKRWWSNWVLFDIFGVCVCIHFFLATLFVFKEKVQLQWFGPPWTLLFLSGHQFFKVRWSWNIDFLLCSYDSKQSSGHRMNPCKLTRVMYISRCLPLKVYVSF